MFGSELAVVMESGRGKLFYQLLGHEHIGLRCRAMHIQKLLESLPDSLFQSILDAGTGDGCYAFYLARNYPQAHVTALDMDAAKIAQGRTIKQRLSLFNISFVEQELVTVTGNEQFDLILCIDVLEHIADDGQVLESFRQLLKPNGLLLLHVPCAEQRHHFGQGELDKIEPGHVRVGYDAIALELKFEVAGLEVVKMKQTFGFFGAWASDLYRTVKGKGAMLFFLLPMLLILAYADTLWLNKNGNGLLLLVMRKDRI